MRISDWSSDVCSSDLEAEQELKRIDAQTVQQKSELGLRQHELGDQLRAKYASGLSPWTALLSGDHHQVVGRDLSYLGYIPEEQAQAVKAVRPRIHALAALQAKPEAGKKALAQFAHDNTEQTPDLEKKKEQNEREVGRKK